MEEYKSFGSDWRVFRLTTFADLIHLDAVDAKNKTDSSKYIVNVVNLAIKALIQQKFGQIQLTGNIETDSQSLKLTKEELINNFDEIWFNINYNNIDIKDTEEAISEIIQYSLYHKKDIAGNTRSYFEYILNNAILLLILTIKEK